MCGAAPEAVLPAAVVGLSLHVACMSAVKLLPCISLLAAPAGLSLVHSGEWVGRVLCRGVVCAGQGDMAGCSYVSFSPVHQRVPECVRFKFPPSKLACADASVSSVHMGEEGLTPPVLLCTCHEHSIALVRCTHACWEVWACQYSLWLSCQCA